MIKPIICVVVLLLGFWRGEGQTPVADSVRSIVQKINANSLDSSCKKNQERITEKLQEYKSLLAKIRSTNLANRVAQIIAGGDSVLPAFEVLGTKDCKTTKTIIKIIKDLDSILSLPSVLHSPDSLDILRAIFYVKNRFSGYVSVKVQALADSNNQIKDPLISIHSPEPSINTHDNAGRAGEIFIRTGVNCLLAITSQGYDTDTLLLNTSKDTSVIARLSALKPAGNNDVEEKITTIIKQGYWWIPATLLVLGLLALGWKFLTMKKKQTFKDEPVDSIQQEIPNDPEKNNPELQELVTQLNKKIKQQEDQIRQYKREATTTKPVSSTKMGTKHFVSEMMMTAGPRKPMKNSAMTDMDLGEDVCGFIMKADEVMVWVLDGASDYTCLRDPVSKKEYFSSRLLAQSIARKLKPHFASANFESFDKTLLTMLSDVKTNWLELVNSLRESEKAILKEDIRSGGVPECSCTAVVGRLTLNGDLDVYRTGDCKLLSYAASGNQKVLVDSSLSTKNNSSFDWIFFRMILTENDEFDIQYNQPLFEIVTLQHIQTIIGFSDGIGQVTQETLKKEYPKNSEAMRNEIIYQLQGTGDDKSLFIVEIKE